MTFYLQLPFFLFSIFFFIFCSNALLFFFLSGRTAVDFCKLQVPLSRAEFSHLTLDERIKSVLRQGT